MAKAYPLNNMVKVQLRAAITDTSTSITFNAPSAPWNTPSSAVGPLVPSVVCLLDDINNPTKFEIVEYTGWGVASDGGGGYIYIDGLTRGAEGTTAQAFDVGAVIVQPLTAESLHMEYIGAALLNATTQDEAKAAIGLSNAGYLDSPVEVASAGFTLALADRGKIKHKSGTTGFTVTIPNNTTVAFPVGSRVKLVNSASSGAITVGIGIGVTLIKLGSGSVASATVAVFGEATIEKVATNTWTITGVGVS